MAALSILERIVFTCAAGLTNCISWPALYVIYKQNILLVFWIGWFTFFTSFMYHMMEAIGINRIYLTVSEWHKLDNIGSIMCFICLTIYLMDNKGSMPFENSPFCNIDVNLFFAGLTLTLFM